MDMGTFHLFIKLIEEEYKLNELELSRLKRRLLADEREFERVWERFKGKSTVSGVDSFRALLQDLVS